MKNKNKIFLVSTSVLVGFAIITFFFSGSATAVNDNKNIAASSPATPALESWSDASKKAADIMKKMYGEPAEQTASMMLWNNNGPWKRTIIYAKEVKHDFPMPHTDVMEQFIDYKVPPEKFTDVAMYDGSVVCNRTNGEMSARCDKEGANFLAINLANDVITGKKDVNAARDFYANSILEFMRGGKPAYMQKLQFDVAKGNTSDSDKTSPVIDKVDKIEMMKLKKDVMEREKKMMKEEKVGMK
ncbi:MAG: hypothetical protein ACT4ON_04570 [Bacteroidota bacterium]